MTLLLNCMSCCNPTDMFTASSLQKKLQVHVKHCCLMCRLIFVCALHSQPASRYICCWPIDRCRQVDIVRLIYVDESYVV